MLRTGIYKSTMFDTQKTFQHFRYSDISVSFYFDCCSDFIFPFLLCVKQSGHLKGFILRLILTHRIDNPFPLRPFPMATTLFRSIWIWIFCVRVRFGPINWGYSAIHYSEPIHSNLSERYPAPNSASPLAQFEFLPTVHNPTKNNTKLSLVRK